MQAADSTLYSNITCRAIMSQKRDLLQTVVGGIDWCFDNLSGSNQNK